MARSAMFTRTASSKPGSCGGRRGRRCRSVDDGAPGWLPVALGTSGCMVVDVGCMLHLGGKAQIVLVEIPGRAASVRRPEPDVTSASSTLPASPITERLSLKPESATAGFVDGAWWPASRDLAAEVSRLIAALADRV